VPDEANPRVRDRIHSVLVVEDDPAMRGHLESAIESDPGLALSASVGTVAEGLAALEAAPDVLLADLGLPDGTGLDVVRARRARNPDALSMVVTALGDERSVLAAIEAGACGYLLKDETTATIASSIHQLLDGGSPIHPAIARFVLRRLQPEAPEASSERDSTPHLSAREHEVLTLVAKGFRFPEIAELFGVSAHTVRTHVRRIYRKLEVGSKGEAVYEAVQLGILRLDD